MPEMTAPTVSDRSLATPARRRRARGVRAAGAAALAALTVALLAATTPQKTADSGKIVAEIRDLEERFNKAYEANDLKAYFDFYSDDMTQLYQQGRLDLPDYRKLWEKEIADGGGMDEVRLKDMVIKVGPSNDSAMAAYLIFTKQRHPGGPPTESWNQETDVLFKRNGRWKVVHVHYSDAPKATAAASASPSPGPRP